MSKLLITTLAGLLCTSASAVEPDSKLPAIKELKGLKPARRTYKESGPKKPLVLRSEKAARLYFTAKNIKTLTSAVDFKQQFVLVFAWRGSGKDQLSYNVAESFPEQVQFQYKRGRTRDLRTHVRIFILRSNVKYSAK